MCSFPHSQVKGDSSCSVVFCLILYSRSVSNLLPTLCLSSSYCLFPSQENWVNTPFKYDERPQGLLYHAVKYRKVHSSLVKIHLVKRLKMCCTIVKYALQMNCRQLRVFHMMGLFHLSFINECPSSGKDSNTIYVYVTTHIYHSVNWHKPFRVM